MSSLARWVTLFCSSILIAVLFLPIWRIDLSAPQYPEGLVLRIYADRIGGDVDIINGLNHYIGMKMLHTRDFVEFVALPYIIGGFLVLGFLVALSNRRSIFYGWVSLLLLIAFMSLIDFYRWEYNYGHNLDEGAPIKVPGMAYQPPLLGYKQLLNFSAWSIPDSGGWTFAGVGVLLTFVAFLEMFRQKRGKPGTSAKITGKTKTVAAVWIVAVLGLGAFSLTGCKAGLQPIHYGQDNCDFCKMGIADKRFGAEILTKKGKTFKFDDMHCLLGFIHSATLDKKEMAGIYLVDFSGDGDLMKADEGYLLKSESLHSPMNGNIAAFRNADSMKKYETELNGQPTTWKELYQ